MYVYEYIYIYVHIYTYIHVYIHVCIDIYIYICIYMFPTHAGTCIYDARVHVYARMYMCAHVYMRIHICKNSASTWLRASAALVQTLKHVTHAAELITVHD